MKKIFLIYILFGASLIASDKGSFLDALEGAVYEGHILYEEHTLSSLNDTLIRYGIPDFEDHFYASKKYLKNSIKDKISDLLSHDRFIVDVDVILEKTLIHDSTYVDVTRNEEEGLFINYKKDAKKQRHAFYDFNTKTTQTVWYPFYKNNLVLYIAYKPLVNISVDYYIDTDVYNSVRTLVVDLLNRGEPGADFSSCDECVVFEAVDLETFKEALIQEELNQAVIEYDINTGFKITDKEYSAYLNDVQKWQYSWLAALDSISNSLFDDRFFLEFSTPKIQYLECPECRAVEADGEIDRSLVGEIFASFLKYEKQGYSRSLYFDTGENPHPLFGIGKLFVSVYVDKKKVSEPIPNNLKHWVKSMLGSLEGSWKYCDDCISFEFVDDMYALKTEMMNKELKDKTVIEYSADTGFTFYDSTYIDYEEDLISELNNLPERGAEIINSLLDDIFFVEASVMNAKFLSDSRFQEIAQLEAENKSKEANKIREQGKAEMKKWDELGYSRPSFSGPFWMFSKLFLKVYVDENEPRIKELLKVSKRPWEFRVKALIYSQYKDLESCDDCIVFELADFNDLKVNQLAKKNQINRSDVYDNSWAVIIGINDYPNAPPLNYAVKDAENIRQLLINNFGFPKENIEFLINNQATYSGIRSALNNIKNKAKGNDRVIVFYSGHGQTVAAQDGTNLGYLIPYEGTLEDPYGTGMSMNFVQQMGLVSEAKHMLFLMDACYSGLMAETSKGGLKIDKNEEGYLAAIANEDSRQIITAGRKDQEVIERDEWENSAFTKNLLSALNDWRADLDQDGYITAEELGLYLKKTVTEDSNQQQTPINSRFQKSGDGEFIFFKN